MLYISVIYWRLCFSDTMLQILKIAHGPEHAFSQDSERGRPISGTVVPSFFGLDAPHRRPFSIQYICTVLM